MEKEIRSYNSRIGVTSRQFLIPNLTQIVIYIIAAGLLLLAANVRYIWSYLGEYIISPNTIMATQNDGWLYRTIDTAAHSRLPQIVFWVFIGSAVYIFIWMTGNVLTNIRNDFVADEYLHPGSYNRYNYWSSILARKIFFGLMIIVFLAYIYTMARAFPLLGNLCRTAVIDFRPLHSSAKLAAALAAAVFLLYLFILLLHLLLNSWKLIFKDL